MALHTQIHKKGVIWRSRKANTNCYSRHVRPYFRPLAWNNLNTNTRTLWNLIALFIKICRKNPILVNIRQK
jgi:hypothetical protein